MTEPDYQNHTGTLEQHRAFVAKVMATGPWQPNTVPHLIPKGLKDAYSSHVVCPGRLIKMNLTEERAEEMCFQFNLAHLKGIEEGKKIWWDKLKKYMAKVEESLKPHEDHEQDLLQCGICDGYCDVRQAMEAIENDAEIL
jgi:hypothetical protein